jgi:pimeloyl-ACP methyl ester carboxylesterase
MRGARAKIRWLAGVLLACAGLGLSGCANVNDLLARQIVEAPAKLGTQEYAHDPAVIALFSHTYAQEWSVPVGPPEAEISVADIEPGDYHLDYKLTVDEATRRGNVRMHWVDLAPGAPRPAAKGTIVLLHGFQMSKEQMMHWGLFLAQQGYRTLLVDLRGHGESTGDWVTYGAVEQKDLRQVLDDAQRRGLAGGKVGVLGISYGAAVGIIWAAHDPRVGALVALEPYSDPQRVVREFARGKLKYEFFWVSDARITAALARAEQLANFSWRDANVTAAAEQAKIPILFYHGAKDTWVPLYHSQVLESVAPPGSKLVVMPDDDHITLSLRLGPMADEVAAWFDAQLAPATK